MMTVARRALRSTPHRDAHETWLAIVDLLARGRAGDAPAELLAVAGIAASVIADQAPRDAAIIVTCDGPRTRIYCLYDDDAIDGADANEDALGFDPLKGDWRVSLPCVAEDLRWVQDALKKRSTRITARDSSASLSTEESAVAKADAPAPLVLDPKGFLDS